MSEAVRRVYLEGIIDKFFLTLEECCICYVKNDNPAKLVNCSHFICEKCYSQLQDRTCPICRATSNIYFSRQEYKSRLCDIVVCSNEVFQERLRENNNLIDKTFKELLTILNSINNVEIDILEQVYNQAEFTTSSEFSEIVNSITMTYHSKEQPTDLQRFMFGCLVMSNAVVLSKTRNFITHTENAILQQIRDLCEMQRQLTPGHLLKVLAFCEDVVSIPRILDLIRDYDPSKIGVIFKYLFTLNRNGPCETIELLEYHKEEEISNIDAFFRHYYHNQWLNHSHLIDERVMDVQVRDGVITAVFGNDYDINGRLCYSGWYQNGKYHGHGKLFNNEEKTYYEGTFNDGLKEGEFVKVNERYKQQVDMFVNDKRNGPSTEYYSDGKRRALYRYVDDKKNGIGYEFMGSGCLRSKYNYVDDIPQDGYEYNSSCTCRKKGSNELLYHPNPECGFEYKNPVYSETYYTIEPASFIVKNEEHGIFHLRFLADESAEFFVNNEVLDLLAQWTEQYKNPFHYVSGKETEQLIIHGDRTDVIDFQKIWDILGRLSRVNSVCLKNFKMQNVTFTEEMSQIVMTTIVFYNCQLECFELSQPVMSNLRTIRFENCSYLSRIHILPQTIKNVKEFTVSDCQDLKELIIEDFNCIDVNSMVLIQGLDNLERISLGKKVFSTCTQVSFQNLPQLRMIELHEHACKNGCDFDVKDCGNLKQLVFGEMAVMNGKTFLLENVPSLEQIHMGTGCFKRIAEVTVNRILDDSRLCADAPSFTTFTCSQPMRKKPTIVYTDANPEGLTQLKTWFKNMK